ncbi:MAG: DUF998 domain-containing protein [Candidatus Lokiarchaeota archaeon]|nr:DUF998 domain-containing protein [Candidatus Lokiarchaeota archaeon]
MDGSTMPVLRRALRGDFTERTLRAFLAAVLVAIAALLTISWMLYEAHNPGDPYNILAHQISHLGNPKRNPHGFILFSAALWVLAIAAVPLLRFYRRALPLLRARVTGVFTAFFALGIPGTALVGFLPSSLDSKAHLVAAALAFGGIGLAFFLSGFGILTSKLRNRNGAISPALAIPFAAFIGFVAFGFAVVGYTAAAGIFDDVEGTWLSFSLWEWLLLGAVCAMCAATGLPLVRVAAAAPGQSSGKETGTPPAPPAGPARPNS